jgi:hypothetical protein
MNGNSTKNNGNPIAPNEKSRVLTKVYAYLLSLPYPQREGPNSQDCPELDKMDSSKSERG